MKSSEILGVVLAGGAGSRMGGRKGELPWGQTTLAGHAAGILGQVLAEVVVAGPAPAGLAAVPDRLPGLGPLAGLEAGLERAAGRPVFALACDLPFVPPELVRHLVDSATVEAAARVALGERGPEPACGLYAGRCLAVARRRLDAGRLSLHGLLEEVGAELVAITPELPFYRPQLFLNLNRPDDLERARRLRAAPAP